MNTRSNSIFNIYRNTFRIANSLAGKRYLLHLCLTVFGSFLEIVGLATVLPLIALMFNANAIQENKFIGRLYNLSQANSVENFVLYCLIGILLFFVVKNIIHVISNFLLTRFCFYLSTLLSFKTLRSYMTSTYDFHTKSNTGYLWQNITVVPSEFAAGMILPVFYLTAEILVLSLIVSALAFYNIKTFLLLSITILPAAWIFYYYIKRKLNWIGNEYNKLAPEANKNMIPALQNYIDIKIMNKENFFTNNIIRYLSQINRNDALTQTINYIPYRLIELTILLGIFCIFIFNRTFSTDLKSMGIIIGIYTTAAFRILPSLNRIVTSLMRIRHNEYVFEPIQTVLVSEEKEQTIKNLKKQQPLSFQQTILLENIYFKYPDSKENALENISLNIKKGDCVGIMGPSGSGKTTLLRILLRLTPEQQGEIRIDNIPLDESRIAAWWKMLGYVQQDVYIMDVTLKENIAFGENENEINHERLQQSIELAGLKNFVLSLPKGLDTNLGELGAKISGGQRQRIGIARALYKDAEIFLFDEITSALDKETENEILESIALLKAQGKTIIIISHRDSTMKQCNKIFKLEKGHLMEEMIVV